MNAVQSCLVFIFFYMLTVKYTVTHHCSTTWFLQTVSRRVEPSPLEPLHPCPGGVSALSLRATTFEPSVKRVSKESPLFPYFAYWVLNQKPMSTRREAKWLYNGPVKILANDHGWSYRPLDCQAAVGMLQIALSCLLVIVSFRCSSFTQATYIAKMIY